MKTQLILHKRHIVLSLGGMPMATPTGKLIYGRIRISTGHQINPEDWNHALAKPSHRYSERDGFALETLLADQVARMNAAYQRAKTEGNATPVRVKELFGNLNGKAKVPVPMVMIDCRFVELVEEVRNKSESDLTASSYDTFLSYIREYDSKIKMSQLDDKWRDGFYADLKQKRTLRENSLWSVNKCFNAVINMAKKKGMRIKIAAAPKMFRLTTPVRDILSWEDLARIIAHQPRTERSAEGKTLLLTTCLTSCRYGDLWSVLNSIEERNGILTCSYTQNKKSNGKHQFVSSPILLPLAEHIAKHGIPPVRCSQHVRRAFVDLMTELEIKKPITIHDGRRFFITSFLGLGMFSEALIGRVYSGHQIRSGDLKVMHGYDQGDITSKQKTFLRILRTIDPVETGGIRLI